MDAKPVSGKCCFFMNMKTGCLLMVYFLLVFQSIVGVQALFHWITKGSLLKTLEVEAMGSWWNFAFSILSIGLALVVSIATICYVVVLLVRVHKDKTKLANFYLMFSAIMLTVTVLFCIVCEIAFDVNPTIIE